MGGSTTLAKARMELEELYLGIPDESVNLTFQDMADLKKQQSASVAATVLPSSSSSDKKQLKKKPSSTAPASLDPISEPAVNNKDGGTSPSPSPPSGSNSMKKLPSLDFNRGLQAAAASNNHSHHHLMMHDHTRNHQHRYDSDQSPILHKDHLYRNTQEHPFHHSTEVGVHAHGHHPLHVDDAHHHPCHHHENHSNFDHATLPTYHHTDYSINRHDHHQQQHHAHRSHSHATMEHSMATYDDTSVMSTAFDRGGGGRRRPGIPHSNICTICSTYIYIFRNRCLVCGRVYCRQCVSIGMGEMTEGRKCIDCLGRRFSQRYIQRAGQVGCCLGYPSRVKQAELEWAEKGPRRNAERGYGHSMMMSRSRSPTPMTPTRNNNTNSNPPSFVMSSPSPYSPYSPVRHPIPF